MALWPFRRKSGRKRSRSGAALSDLEGAPLRSQTEGGLTRTMSKKKQRTEQQRPPRRQRTYSFSPGRDDDIHVDRSEAGSHVHGPRGRTGGEQTDNVEGAGAWDRTPTLYHKSSDQNATRRRSSKRRRDDHDREAEIKAMSTFAPVRPATDAWTSGRPMKKDSKRIKTMSFGRHLDHPQSEISLPLPCSIHSSLSSDSEFGAFRISALDALAPRPTLRYAQINRWAPSRSSAQTRSGSQKRRLREPIPEESLGSRQRVDELADNLDASDLRELLERDNRRRERKRQREQERMERRLTRRAEKQKTEEAESKHSGTPPPMNLERGVMGRELVGLGIEPASAVRTSSKHQKAATPELVDGAQHETLKDPRETFHRSDTIPSVDHENAHDQATQEEAIAAKEETFSLSGRHLASLRSKRSRKSQSKSTLTSDREKAISPPSGTIDEEDLPRKDSESSSRAGRFSFSNFLKWGGKSRRDSGPSSFSNTSREEMQAAQAQALALAKLQGDDLPSQSDAGSATYLARKSSASVPKRTMSRFREDLPDFPVSPPASRVQSPDIEPTLPAVSECQANETRPLPIPVMRYGTPTSGHRSIEAMRQTPTSMNMVYASPSPEPHMSMSLASIDSEASWLSGRVAGKRSSTKRNDIKCANLQEYRSNEDDSPGGSAQEDLAIADDDYLSRLTPRRHSGQQALSRRSGEGRPSSDEEDLVDASMKWGAVGARPHVVQRLTMKSYEGLLNIESEDEENEETSPVSPSGLSEGEVRRARSVNLGRGHVRNFSAGSAKLLDITPRGSVDRGRRSLDRRRSSGALFAQ